MAFTGRGTTLTGIGATAIHLGFDVATLNVKHFQLVPGLKIVTPQLDEN